MESAGLVDQLLDIHRDCYGFRDAAGLRASLSRFCEPCGFGEPRMHLVKAAAAPVSSGLAILSSIIGDSDALVAAEVERIRSNLVALLPGQNQPRFRASFDFPPTKSRNSFTGSAPRARAIAINSITSTAGIRNDAPLHRRRERSGGLVTS